MTFNKYKGFVKLLSSLLLLIMLSSLVMAAPTNVFTFDSEYEYVESKGDFSAERFELTTSEEGISAIFDAENPVIRIGNDLSNLEIEASKYEIKFRPENGILRIGDKLSPTLSFEIKDFMSTIEVGNPNLMSNLFVYNYLNLFAENGTIIFDSLNGNLILESYSDYSEIIIGTNGNSGFISYQPNYDQFGGAIVLEQNASFETLGYTVDEFYDLMENLKRGSILGGGVHTAGQCLDAGGTPINPIYLREGLTDAEIKALPAFYDGTDVCWFNRGSVSGWTLTSWTFTKSRTCYGGRTDCAIACETGGHPANLDDTVETCVWYYGSTSSDWDDDDHCVRHAKWCVATVTSGVFY